MVILQHGDEETGKNGTGVGRSAAMGLWDVRLVPWRMDLRAGLQTSVPGASTALRACKGHSPTQLCRVLLHPRVYMVLQSGVMDLFLSWLSPPRCRNLSPPMPFKREAPSEGCSVIWGQESEASELRQSRWFSGPDS